MFNSKHGVAYNDAVFYHSKKVRDKLDFMSRY